MYLVWKNSNTWNEEISTSDLHSETEPEADIVEAAWRITVMDVETDLEDWVVMPAFLQTSEFRFLPWGITVLDVETDLEDWLVMPAFLQTSEFRFWPWGITVLDVETYLVDWVVMLFS